MDDLKRIRTLRKQLQLTQSELADQAKVSQSLIAKIENGHIKPSYAVVTKILSVLEDKQDEQKPRAGDFVITKVFTCSVDDPVKKVILKMRKEAISQMPVMEQGVMVGMVTESSLLDHALDSDLAGLTARKVMSSAPPTVDVGTPRDAVVGLLRHVPIVVVTKAGKIFGIITRADMIRSTFS